MQHELKTASLSTTVIKFSILLLGNLICQQAIHAHWNSPINQDTFQTARPYVTIGDGLTLNIPKAEDQFIPIANPDQDQYFRYRSDSKLQLANYFELSAGAEMQIYSGWSWQLGVSYNNSSVLSAGKLTQGTEPATESTFNYRYGVSSNQFLLENKFLYHYHDIYHPYFMIGLGESLNRFEDYSTNIPAGLTFTQQYSNHKTHSFSYALGVGIDANLTDNVRLGFGYRFTDLGKVESGSAIIDNVSGNGRLKLSHFYASEIFAQITFLLM